MAQHLVADPPMTSDQSQSEDETGSPLDPPPSPHQGILFHIAATMSILTFALQMFNIDGHSPGLLRAVDGAGNILDLQTWFTNITWPRRLYLQLSSFTEFQKVVTLCAPMRHSPPLSWEEQQEQDVVPCRIYVHYISVFHTLERLQVLIHTQNNKISRFETHIAQLQHALRTETPLQAQPNTFPVALDISWARSRPISDDEAQPENVP